VELIGPDTSGEGPQAGMFEIINGGAELPDAAIQALATLLLNTIDTSQPEQINQHNVGQNRRKSARERDVNEGDSRDP
jgi:hypothetical protein